MPAKRLRSDTEEGDYLRDLQFFNNLESGFLEPFDIKQFVSVLEPILRKVVHEEVKRGLFKRPKTYQRALPQAQAPAMEAKPRGPPPAMFLAFEKPLSLPIFTATKIEDEEGNPLRILLVDPSQDQTSPRAVDSQVKIRVEVVVLDGDFPGEKEDWTSEEFDRNIVKERAGKKSLISGDTWLTLRGGSLGIGDISITDNSSWIRSRQFRVGVRVPGGSHGGVRIREAISEPFMVKDHRGESYKKHYPPAATDEVWRLEKIGKDGAYHKRLQAEYINTVHDFLQCALYAPNKLRTILGPNMSDKTWEVAVAHAKTCELQPQPMSFDRCSLPSSLKLNGVQEIFFNAQFQSPIYSLYSPKTPLTNQLLDCESSEVHPQVSLPYQGAIGQHNGFDESALSCMTFFPAAEGREFAEFNGEFEMEVEATIDSFLQPDNNIKPFFSDF